MIHLLSALYIPNKLCVEKMTWKIKVIKSVCIYRTYILSIKKVSKLDKQVNYVDKWWGLWGKKYKDLE